MADLQAAGPTPGFVRRRVLPPLVGLLRQGHTPEKIALSVALGVAFGLFPIFGTTTLLCVLAGVILRLNHPALQLSNQLMYPVQIPLILVFVRLGEVLLGASPMAMTIPVRAAELRVSPAVLLDRLGLAGLHGVVGWAAVAPAVAGIVYALTLWLLRNRGAAREQGASKST
jgi:uncharacterized protein (DUF2062 family)